MAAFQFYFQLEKQGKVEWVGDDSHVVFGQKFAGCKKSAHPPSYMIFCTLTPKICWYYHLPLHHTTTTTEQMAATVPEIMDILVYNFNKTLHCTNQQTPLKNISSLFNCICYKVTCLHLLTPRKFQWNYLWGCQSLLVCLMPWSQHC
jgi:hypothetical protein